MVTITDMRKVSKILNGAATLVKLSSAVVRGSGDVSKSNVGIALALSATAGTLVYRYARPWIQAENAKLRQVLEGGGVNPAEASEMVTDVVPACTEETVYFGDIPVVMTTVAPETDVPCKRRIKKGCRGSFIREIVAAVKLRLGTPKTTMANRRAVMRVAREELKEYNLRKVVAASVMPTIVEAVFVPNKWEVQAAALGSSALAQARKMKVSLLLEMAGFDQA